MPVSAPAGIWGPRRSPAKRIAGAPTKVVLLLGKEPQRRIWSLWRRGERRSKEAKRSFRRLRAETKQSGLCDDEVSPPGRVPFGTARKEPKGGLGAQPRLNSGQRVSLVRRACPLRTPVLRGSKTGAAFSYRRTPADTPSDARRPPAFCRRNLPHFYHAYGRLAMVFKPAGLFL